MVASRALCQQDTITRVKDLQRVEVKADRILTAADKLPMPVTIISRKMIEMMGSRRLDEVLREQTGLAIVNDIGAGSRAVGLQMQGFSAAYTMILIDGQPMLGRNSGNFDLSRITVANIERIEIIKGAASCMYGGDAMAGVINIITRKNTGLAQAMALLRYGSNSTADATLEGEAPFAGNKGAAYFSGNYYRTAGFNVNPYLATGTTAPPYTSYTLQGRATYDIDPYSSLTFSGRYASRSSVNEFNYFVTPMRDELTERDANGTLAWQHQWRDSASFKAQYYISRYTSTQSIADLKTDAATQSAVFGQYMHRLELRSVCKTAFGMSVTTGIGGIYEILDNAGSLGTRSMQTGFGFAQAEWKTSEKLQWLGGARYDHHNRYGGKLSPDLGLRYTPVTPVTIRLSVSSGFKTPDFRQLYQSFTNMQAGYTVLGTEVFGSSVKALQDAGQVDTIWPVAARVAGLKPERSWSFNAGVTFTPVRTLKLDVNAFYNDVRNMINSTQVGVKINGGQLFSYINLDRVRLTGLEAGLSWDPLPGLSLSAGYQLLYAKDNGVQDSIRTGAGKYAWIQDRTTDTMPRRAAVPDYFGLEYRSRHMANWRIFYEYAPWATSATFRVHYRGKYGYADANNNNYIDRYDTFVNGFFQLSASMEKKLCHRHLSLQLSVDNLLDYTDMLMPGMPGRVIMAGISWRFFKDQ
ncbi:TonB-dependent receptor plug domain-containing protein [Chitinophaga japonensis]|nr:TonB-dependent receptor [Chitinophaga japonensis]